MILINFIITKILTQIQFYSFNEFLEIIMKNSLLKNSFLLKKTLPKNNLIKNSIENIIFHNNKNYMEQYINFTLYQENDNYDYDFEKNFECDFDCDYGWYVILDV
jgi:hypothetical protein